MSASIHHFKKTHTINSWLSLILSSFVVVCVFLSIVSNLVAQPDEIVQEVGLKTFRMFTVLSNMFVGITASMSIPFAVDGIRQRNYHLPRWIVNLTLMSVSSITLTFVITACLLAPRAGFGYMLLQGSNLFMHTLIPLASIASFLLINSYHTVRFKTTVIALLPVVIYAVIYIVSAIWIGEEGGGWRDHYHFEELMPWYYVAIFILLLTFGISNCLRVVHNVMHRRDKLATAAYYQTAAEYDLPTIEEAINALANENKANDAGGEIIVPRRIIKILEQKYKSNHPLSYLCRVYLDAYLK
jgi:hypothetical protein